MAAPDLPPALNFGPDESQTVTVGELVDHAARAWKRDGGTLPSPPTTLSPRPNMVETGHLVIDSTLATATLGWHNVIDWRTAADWTIDWYRRPRGASATAVMDDQLSAYQGKVQNHG